MPDVIAGSANGPVISWQPAAQPVAAGPAKVGANVPRLDEVTAAARVARALTLEFAAADTPKVTSSVTTIDRGSNRVTRRIAFRRMTGLLCLGRGWLTPLGALFPTRREPNRPGLSRHKGVIKMCGRV